MSWSRRFEGTPQTIWAAMTAEQHDRTIPDPVQSAIHTLLAALPATKPIVLETSGHIDAAGGTIKIEVKAGV